jgi:integrase/recombinase XerD
MVRRPDRPADPPRLRDRVKDFVRFTGITRPDEFRTMTRAHVIAWRDELARRGLGGSTVRPGSPACRRARA